MFLFCQFYWRYFEDLCWLGLGKYQRMHFTPTKGEGQGYERDSILDIFAPRVTSPDQVLRFQICGWPSKTSDCSYLNICFGVFRHVRTHWLGKSGWSSWELLTPKMISSRPQSQKIWFVHEFLLAVRCTHILLQMLTNLFICQLFLICWFHIWSIFTVHIVLL